MAYGLRSVREVRNVHKNIQLLLWFTMSWKNKKQKSTSRWSIKTSDQKKKKNRLNHTIKSPLQYKAKNLKNTSSNVYSLISIQSKDISYVTTTDIRYNVFSETIPLPRNHNSKEESSGWTETTTYSGTYSKCRRTFIAINCAKVELVLLKAFLLKAVWFNQGHAKLNSMLACCEPPPWTSTQGNGNFGAIKTLRPLSHCFKKIEPTPSRLV